MAISGPLPIEDSLAEQVVHFPGGSLDLLLPA
jgi:hypothetical protein